MGKGKKKGNKRTGNADDEPAPAAPQKRLTKKEQRALEREAEFLAAKGESLDVSTEVASNSGDTNSVVTDNSKGRKGKKGKRRGGKQQNDDVEATASKVNEMTLDGGSGDEDDDYVMVKDAPKQAKSAFAALDDSEEEEEEEEEEVVVEAPKQKASAFAALDDSEEEDEEEEEIEVEAPKPKASAFAALDDSEEEDEEEEEVEVEAPKPKASAFAVLDDSEEEDEEEVEVEAPKPKSSGFAALDDSEDEDETAATEDVQVAVEDDDELDPKAAKKKAKKEKKEKKKKSKKGEESEDDESDGKQKKKKKLSNKERRKLKATEEAAEREAAATRIVATDFAVSRTAIKYDDAWANATDINIPQFTISAYGKTLFENAELKIAHGRRYGLVGPNGMGKTTVLKQLANGQLEIPPKIDCLYVEQEVVADDTPAVQMVLAADTKRTRLLEREKEIMRRMDEEEYSEELQEELRAVSLEMTASGADTAEARALAILHGLGFDAQMQQAPTKSFSGGWRMRVSIARALFVQPTLLLLDEPTNHLDLNAVIWLDDYLQKWKTTLLVVSHDQDFLDSVCTDIIHLDQRQLFYYRGNYEMFKSQYEQTKLKQLRAYEKQQQKLRLAKKSGKSGKTAQADLQKKKSREGGGAKKGKKNQQQESSADNTSGRLLDRPKDYEVHFEFPEPTELAPPIIQVKDISFNYPNGPTLFKDLSFGIDMDSRITIVGPNGVGKSTLLKLMTNELDSTQGEVLINRHLRIARYHQHFVDVLPMNETPVEFLTRVHSENATYQLARNRLGKFGLPGTAHTIKMMNLSGGQKSRVVFASLSFQEPHIIILDEPTNNLDIESIDALSDAINDFSGGVVLVSHDARLIQSTEMVLWVCENATVEEMVGGFDAYKNEILTEIAKKDEENRLRLEARMQQKLKEREEKVKRMKEKLKAKAAAAAQ